MILDYRLSQRQLWNEQKGRARFGKSKSVDIHFSLNSLHVCVSYVSVRVQIARSCKYRFGKLLPEVVSPAVCDSCCCSCWPCKVTRGVYSDKLCQTKHVPYLRWYCQPVAKGEGNCACAEGTLPLGVWLHLSLLRLLVNGNNEGS